MKEHPIIFSAEMIRAILDGRKTQTRRVIKPQPGPGIEDFYHRPSGAFQGLHLPRGKGVGVGDPIRCPYGVPGDRLWVRETWATDYLHDSIKPSDLTERDSDIFYRADGNVDAKTDVWVHRWRPSIFMPRWASRITLEVKAVRVERVQDISPADAVAEGISEWTKIYGCLGDLDPSTHVFSTDWIATFAQFWDSINAKRGHPWSANDWVWAVEFEEAQ